MNIICLLNNRAGWRAARFLARRANIVAAVLHPEEHSRYRSEIEGQLPLAAPRFDAASLSDESTLRALCALEPDLVLSVYFGYILRPAFLEGVGCPVLNLHPGLLPYNRGAYPNVWPILDGTPAGVTLHMVDPGVDTGPIVASQAVEVAPEDTGATLYGKLEDAALELLERAWPTLRAGTWTATPQDPKEGSTHRKADVAELDQLDLDASVCASTLINLLRARTFEDHPSAYFMVEGRKIYLRLTLHPE